MSLRELFGGAIVANIPVDLIDASNIPDFPPVPDTQELLLYPNYNISVVVEILQGVEKHGEDAIRFHFDALAHDNSAHESAVKKVYNVPIEQEDAHTNRPLALVGTQYIHKKRGAPPDEVRIAMCLFPVRKRINEHEVIDNDLVVTFNVPIQSADGRAAGEEGWVKSEQDFNALATSLRILDHGLFVPKAVEHW